MTENTNVPASAMDHVPFARLLGMEITEADDGHAVGELELEEKHASNPTSGIVHGGVTYALADTTAGAAASTLNEGVTPTVDMRIDYVNPAIGERLRAEADVVRNGGTVATVDVEVTTGEGTLVATARGSFKAGGSSGDSPWEVGREDPIDGRVEP